MFSDLPVKTVLQGWTPAPSPDGQPATSMKVENIYAPAEHTCQGGFEGNHPPAGKPEVQSWGHTQSQDNQSASSVCFEKICLPECGAFDEHQENMVTTTAHVNQSFLKPATTTNLTEILVGLNSEQICEKFDLKPEIVHKELIDLFRNMSGILKMIAPNFE